MELLELIKDALDKVKATDVKIYDLRGSYDKYNK